MATLWIREYTGLGRSGSAPIPQEPGLDQSPVAITDYAQSAAFAASTTIIAMMADVAFHYVVGLDPDATTNSFPTPANTIVHVGVTAGHKVAVVAAA